MIIKGQKVKCTPGKQCFDCPYDDCIRSVRKIYHEEVEMFKCASLPVDRSRKKRKRQKKQTLPPSLILKENELNHRL